MGHEIELLKECLQEALEEKEKDMADIQQKENQPMIRETESGPEKYCSACEDYHPATEDYFYKDGRSKTKLSSWCKEATLAKQKKYRDKKKVGPGQRTGLSKVAPTILLCFLGMEDLMERISTAAKEAFRTPEQQVMFWADQALKRGDRINEPD